MRSFDNTIICLMGPTASGKTQLALELAQQIPSEIISVDSALVYRGMDIGTAKPSQEELAQIPHHLIDIIDPAESYSVGRFRKDALQAISAILEKKKIPLLVGGTMLYFKALQQGLSVLPPADVGIRTKLSKEADESGWQALHERLITIDPVAAGRIHPNDPQRIQRALEIFELTGKTMTEWQLINKIEPLSYRTINLAIAPSDRFLLRETIMKRFENMLDQGFVEEVQRLFECSDLHRDLPSMRSVGYRQVWDYLEGKTTFDEMKTLAITATCQLAKRQLTWLRSWPDLQWLNSRDLDKISLSDLKFFNFINGAM